MWDSSLEWMRWEMGDVLAEEKRKQKAAVWEQMMKKWEMME